MTIEPLGRYEMLEELGRGAMGTVYKARDPLIDRMVAVKVVDLDASLEETEAFERRFYREAKSAGRLNHVNIVTIHDVGRSGNRAYIAMEFLEGKSLRQVIDSGVVLPQDQIADIAAQIADGLACAHQNGVIHRDIKPANIMLLDSGTVKITDFGIALLPRGSRTLGSVFGSPKYISPEQVVGKEADGRSDIFALGAVLYELLTGSPAFTASDLDAILSQVIHDEPPPPRSRNRNIVPGFDYIVAKAMAKGPEDRYATAQEMARDLRNFRFLERPVSVEEPELAFERSARRRAAKEEARPGSESVNARPPDESQVVIPASSSRRRPIKLLAASFALVAVASVWTMAHKRPQAEENAPAQTAALVPPLPAPSSAVEPPPTQSPAPPETAKQDPVPPAPVPAAAARQTPAPAVARKAPAAAARTARLAFAVTPWGEVYVDGRRRGISPPLKEVKVPPGKHVVEIRNANFKRHSQTVDLVADASVRIKYKFQ